VEDIVYFEVDDNPDLEYFERNNITHFGKFTCDYETGDLYDDTRAASARGRIEVSVDDRRNITVTDDAECDDTSYDETNWQWFQTFRTEIENSDLRARSGNDEKDSDEEDETEAQDDEDEDEDQVDSDETTAMSRRASRHFFVGFHHGKRDHILCGRSDYATWPTMEGSSGPLITAVDASTLTAGARHISFLDFPSEVKDLVYYYLYRDRTKRAINLCVLSPAWKSPSPPTAFMNTCSSIASGLMPLYFSNCLFTIDTAYKANAQLLKAAFKWLKKVGDKSSAQFRRLHIIHERTITFQYEIIISITNENQVIIEELKGPAKLLYEESLQLARGHQRTWSFHPAYKTLYLRLDKELTEDLVETLTHRINTNETGAMGVAEFEIILERISFHLSEFNKEWDELMDRGIYELLD
ncbi:hypothetical protein KCU78_g15834, partial [Aureobasidium melanogenum]